MKNIAHARSLYEPMFVRYTLPNLLYTIYELQSSDTQLQEMNNLSIFERYSGEFLKADGRICSVPYIISQ